MQRFNFRELEGGLISMSHVQDSFTLHLLSGVSPMQVLRYGCEPGTTLVNDTGSGQTENAAWEVHMSHVCLTWACAEHTHACDLAG